MKSLVFTAESSYARFRCPHTTTSALTFTTIHPIAAKGLIGAIMGVEYNSLYEYTKDMKIGVQVLNPVYKDMQAFNLIAMVKNNGAPNFQSRIQFLRDVKYRIFIVDEESKLTKIGNVIEKHEYVFTPYLGCSEHIAKLELEGMYDILNPKEMYVDTLVPKEMVKLNEGDELTLYFDRIPTKNSKEREYIEYKNIVFSPKNKLQIEKCDIYKVGEYNVFFF